MRIIYYLKNNPKVPVNISKKCVRKFFRHCVHDDTYRNMEHCRHTDGYKIQQICSKLQATYVSTSTRTGNKYSDDFEFSYNILQDT